MSLPVTRGALRANYARPGDSFTSGWLRTATADPNLIIIAAFCLIGLLATLNLIFGFPSLQPSLEQLAQTFG
jgi:hypothetical protein